MQPVMTVSQCVEVISQTLEATFGSVSVSGEVSSYNEWNGRLAFFDIKDAESVLSCMVPMSSLDVPVEIGMQVQVVAVPKVTKKGRFNLLVRRVLPQGDGALHQAFGLLKSRLEAEGVFADEKKRTPKSVPRSIAVVTSLESAAYQDVLAILKQRSPSLEVFAVNTLVQGEAAAEQIVSAVEYVNKHLSVDALVLTRGGGSLEDLIAFNSEPVVRSVSASKTPTVVATGHERDTTLAELAADKRAATPTDAANKVSASRRDLSIQINDYARRIRVDAEAVASVSHSSVFDLATGLEEAIEGVVNVPQVQYLSSQLNHYQSRVVEHKQERLESLVQLLESYNPEEVLKRGYSIVRKDKQIIDTASGLVAGDEIVIQFKDGEILSQVKKR